MGLKTLEPSQCWGHLFTRARWIFILRGPVFVFSEWGILDKITTRKYSLHTKHYIFIWQIFVRLLIALISYFFFQDINLPWFISWRTSSAACRWPVWLCCNSSSSLSGWVDGFCCAVIFYFIATKCWDILYCFYFAGMFDLRGWLHFMWSYIHLRRIFTYFYFWVFGNVIERQCSLFKSLIYVRHMNSLSKRAGLRFLRAEILW